MFSWHKLGQVFDPTRMSTFPWMHHYAQTPATLMFDDFVRVYFCTRGPADESGQFISRIGYVDLERDDLFQIRRISPEPVLALGGLGTFDEFGTNPVSVIRHGDEIWAYYAGWTRCESVPFNSTIGVARSVDGGESFQRIGPGPVLSFTPDEPFVIGSPKVRRFDDKWYLHYIAGQRWLDTGHRPEPVYVIRGAVSDDGIEWQRFGTDLLPKRLGDSECQASADILWFEDRYRMFFSYRHAVGFKSKERGYRIGYAASDDLVHWSRDDLSAGIDVSEEGWDSQMVSYAHVFELDDRVYMLYQGNDIGRVGFGLAALESYKAGSLA
jgi:predicted GH43/DUF377 family glycosyl hydrolase